MLVSVRVKYKKDETAPKTLSMIKIKKAPECWTWRIYLSWVLHGYLSPIDKIMVLLQPGDSNQMVPQYNLNCYANQIYV